MENPSPKKPKPFYNNVYNPTKKRMSWDQLFAHPLMKGRGAIVEPTINLDEKAQKIIRKM